MTPWTLLAKYITKQASPLEQNEIEQWLAESPRNKDILQQLIKIYEVNDSQLPDFASFQEMDWIYIVNRLPMEQRRKTVPLFSNVWIRVTAAMFVLCIAGSLIWYTGNKSHRSDISNISSSDSLYNDVLPDGTVVWLNKHSSLEVLDGYNEQERRVSLTGEAFFQVKKNPSVPFIVSTGDISTKVLGTSFDVRNNHSDSSLSVTVVEGKVNVYETDRPDSGELLIHDEVVVYDHHHQLTKRANANLNFLSWKTGVIRFENDSLKNVCSFLSEYYGRDIRSKNSDLDKHIITTVLDHKTLDESLQVISLTLGLHIEQQGVTIYLTE